MEVTCEDGVSLSHMSLHQLCPSTPTPTQKPCPRQGGRNKRSGRPPGGGTQGECIEATPQQETTMEYVSQYTTVVIMNDTTQETNATQLETHATTVNASGHSQDNQTVQANMSHTTSGGLSILPFSSFPSVSYTTDGDGLLASYRYNASITAASGSVSTKGDDPATTFVTTDVHISDTTGKLPNRIQFYGLTINGFQFKYCNCVSISQQLICDGEGAYYISVL